VALVISSGRKRRECESQNTAAETATTSSHVYLFLRWVGKRKEKKLDVLKPMACLLEGGVNQTDRPITGGGGVVGCTRDGGEERKMKKRGRHWTVCRSGDFLDVGDAKEEKVSSTYKGRTTWCERIDGTKSYRKRRVWIRLKSEIVLKRGTEIKSMMT